MMLLALGILAGIFLAGYFAVSDMEASVFPALGFADEEISVMDVEFTDPGASTWVPTA